MKFNINNHVKVKLTERGRELHKKDKLELMKHYEDYEDYEYVPPKEDEDGWSRW